MNEGGSPDRSAQGAGSGPAPAPRPLRLADPLDDTAAEDRPESWGERSSTDDQRLAAYQAARPPHHGE